MALCSCGATAFILEEHGFRCAECSVVHFWHDHVSLTYNTNGHELDVRFKVSQFLDAQRADSAPKPGGRRGGGT